MESSPSEKASAFMTQLSRDAEQEWERLWPVVLQAAMEAGGGDAALAQAEQMRPQLREAFLAGVAVAVGLISKRRQQQT
jgi:hypothetical protein